MENPAPLALPAESKDVFFLIAEGYLGGQGTANRGHARQNLNSDKRLAHFFFVPEEQEASKM